MALNKNKVIAAAQRYTQKNQLDRAIKEYRTIVDEDPNDVRIWLKIGDLQTKKGDVRAAVATYNRVATHYRDEGRLLKAVAVYKAILNIDPRFIEAHLNLGDLYVQLGFAPDAIAQYQIVVGTYEREGRHRDSLDLLKKIVDLAPDDEANRIRLAEAYARQEELPQAIEQFEMVLEQLHARQRFDDFIQVAERLLYLAPDQLATIKQLSDVYLKRGDARRALARLQTLFKADPQDAETLALLGSAFAAIGQREKAVQVYRELARIHADRGNQTGRAQAYRQILELEPGDPEALQATGGVNPVQHGQPQHIQASRPPASPAPVEDELTTEEQLRLYVSDVDIYLKYELFDHARERLAKVLELDPDNEQGLLRRRDIALRADDKDAAVDALMRLARVKSATQPEQAMAYLGEVLQIVPGHPEAKQRMNAVSSGMARALASSDRNIPLAPPPPPEDDFDVDLDLDELDFSEDLDQRRPVDAEPAGFELDFGELEAADDDDAFGDLLGEDLRGARPMPPSGDDFGDLLADEPEAPAHEDEFAGLLVDSPRRPAPARVDDDFGDLLIDDEPPAFAAPSFDDELGGLLAAPQAIESEIDGVDELAGLLEDEPAPAYEPEADELGGLLLDDSGASAAGDDLDDLLFDDEPEPLRAEPPRAAALVPPPPEMDDHDELPMAQWPSEPPPLVPPPLVPPPPEPLEPMEEAPAFGFVADDLIEAPVPDDDEFADLLGGARPGPMAAQAEPVEDPFGDLLAPDDPVAEPASDDSWPAALVSPDDEDQLGQLAGFDDDEEEEERADEDATVVGDLSAFAALRPATALRADEPPPPEPPPPEPPPPEPIAEAPEVEFDLDDPAFEEPPAPAPAVYEIDLDLDDEDASAWSLDDLAPADAEEPAQPEPAAQQEIEADDLILSEEEQAPAAEEPEAPAEPEPALSDDLDDIEIGDDDSAEYQLEADIASLPGVMDDLGLPEIVGRDEDEIEILDDDDIIELDDEDVSLEVEASAEHQVDEEEDDDLPAFVKRLDRGAGPRAPAPPPPPPGSNFFDVRPPPPPEQEEEDDLLDLGDLASPAPGALLSAPPPEPAFQAPEEPDVIDQTMAAEGFEIPELTEELAEIDFLLESGLTDDARDLLRELTERHPDHPELPSRQGRLSELEAEPDAEELIGSLEAGYETDPGTIQGTELSELTEDDANTHFDLGVAFKEMGQYRKAIEQLEIAARSHDMRPDALRVMALCRLETGNVAEAVAHLTEALQTPNLSTAARVGLRYDLATAYEALGDPDRAAAQLRAILQDGAPDFLDVKTRLARLDA